MPSRYLIIIFLLLVGNLHAKQMYKYTDDQGILHYTDKKPVTS